MTSTQSERKELVKRADQQVAQRTQDVYSTVLAAVNDPDTDPARLREFLAIAQDMEADHARKQFTAAFQAAKAEMDSITITKRGKIQYKSGSAVKYAQYDDIARAVKPILNRHGLAESFSYEYTESPPKVICVMKVTHVGGHSEVFRSVPLPMVDSSGGKNDIQGAGSVASYGKRFVIVPAFDIVTEDEDDDGSGQGVADPITDEQAQAIEACLETIEQRKPGSRKKFFDWLNRAYQTREIAELRQGVAFDGVMSMLKKRLAGEK